MRAYIKAHFSGLYLFSIPLLVAAFSFSVFFTGTENPYFAPSFFCLSLFGLLCMAAAPKDGIKLPQTATFLSILAFWFYIIISSTWSSVPYISTMFVLVFSILPGYFIFAQLAADREKWARIHAGAIIAVIAVFAAWAIVQFVFLFDIYGPRIHHPMLNPNNLAGLFNIALFPMIAFFFTAKKESWQIATTTLIAVLYFGLITTQSRGAFLACIIVTAIFLPLLLWRRRDDLPWLKIAIFVLLAVAIPLFANALHTNVLSVNLVNTARDASGALPASITDRVHLWRSTLDMVADHAWLGTGLATFYFYYPAYRNPLDNSDGFFAHMDPLQLWAETGVLAPLLFYTILICVLWRTIAALRACPRDDNRYFMILGAFMGMLALTGHTHITFHFYMPAMLLALAAILTYWYAVSGAVLKQVGIEKQDRSIFRTQKSKYIVIGGVCGAIALANIWNIRAAIATIYFGDIRQSMARGQLDEARNLLEIATMISPSTNNRGPEMKARLALADLRQALAAQDIQTAQKAYLDGLIHVEKAIILNPAFEAMQDLKAQFYMSAHGVFAADGRAQAIQILKDVLITNPMRSDSRIGLALIYKANGEYRKALSLMEAGERWPRRRGMPDIQFLIELGDLYKLNGQMDRMRQVREITMQRAAAYGMPVTMN
jgi:O-antigen ligase